MYTLKSIAQRGTMLGAATALLIAAVVPSAVVFADGLNPLTERSLLLSSSAPGFQDTDGSGNSSTTPNSLGEYYALPGSGPNGKKTGQTFTFRVSTDSLAEPATKTLRAFTLQYCTSAAGNCQAPGNNTGDARDSSRILNETPTTGGWALNKSDFNVVTDGTTPWAEGSTAGTYQVLLNGAAQTGWSMSTKNVEDDAHSGALTGKNNFIVLSNATGITPDFNDQITIKFTPSDTNFITNPGADEFFVKINDYNVATEADMLPTTSANILDGGVTVANVMTDSIHITTKVLETMAFSVGTQNKDTQAVQHGSCDAIQVINNNRLDLGDPDAENSLRTDTAYDTNSYWRLSSNSSGGATVYYSGDTLRNTVGDHIADMPIRQHSQPGTEQFGIALVNAGADAADPEGLDADGTNDFPSNWSLSNISPLIIETPYAGGDVASISDETSANNAEFAFKQSSKAVPEIIAQNGNQVITCATAKVRYVANIAADTPAGVYTTKINYLAAPQY